MVYDSLLIFAVLFFATAIALLFNHGEAIVSSTWFSLYLLFMLYSYYAWFWQKSGQTLGMRVWKIRLVRVGRKPRLGHMLPEARLRSTLSVVFRLRILVAVVQTIYLA